MALPSELERLLKQVTNLARQNRVSSSDFTVALTQLGADYARGEQAITPDNQIPESFKQIKPIHYMIASFQNDAIKDGKVCGWDHQATYREVNARFGTDFKAGASRGNTGEAYVVLEKTSANMGRLWSYSYSHQDAVGRWNMGFFEVIAEYSSLGAAMKEIEVNNKSLSLFVKTVFPWDNSERPTNLGHGQQPDLFVYLNNVHFARG